LLILLWIELLVKVFKSVYAPLMITPTVELCDARNDAASTKAGLQNLFYEH